MVRDELESLRDAMADIDEQIVALLHQRAALCRRAGEIKQGHGLPIRCPAREAIVLARVRNLAKTQGMSSDALVAIFEEIICCCRELQEGVATR